MGEKEGRNTRVLSLFVRLSYGDILKKKEEARHYQVTERTIQRGSGDNPKRSGRRTQDGQGRSDASVRQRAERV